MNYTVKALRVFMKGENTDLEDYQKDVLNFSEAVKEKNRLQSTGEYVNISISKIESPHT